MTLSFALALLSLFGYLAVIAMAVQATCAENREKADPNSWQMSNHSFDNMPEVINWALRHCLDRGHITIKARGAAYAIRFNKYIPRKGAYGIEFSFPVAEWSTPLLPRLRAALAKDGVRFRETPRPIGDSWLWVDCGQDVGKAVDLARRCFIEIFGLSADTRFQTKPKSFYPYEDIVNDPDYADAGALHNHWLSAQARKRAEGHSGPPLALRICAAFYFIGFMLCHPILLAAWYSAAAGPSDWHIPSAGLQGHWNVVVLLLIYCGLLVGGIGTSRQFRKYRKPRPKPPWIGALGSRLITSI